MELQADFIKDIKNNYMVLQSKEEEGSSFTLKMLAKNNIQGLLKLEVKTIDNQKYYYYDITSKRPLSEILERSPVTYKQIKKIYDHIFRLPDILKEYLIDENSILLEPQFIYMDNSGNTVEFCYYPGKTADFREEISGLTDKLLNKVDYKDEKAVLAIYAVYQISHDDSCTLETLKKVFEKQQEISLEKTEEKKEEQLENMDSRIRKIDAQNIEIENTGTEGEKETRKIKKIKESKESKASKEWKEQKEQESPHMEERIENQREVMRFPKKVYVQAIAALLIGIFLMIAVLISGVLNEGGVPKMNRYLIMAVVFLLAESGCFLIIFRKENQCAEIVEEEDYLDWNEEYDDSLAVPEIEGITSNETTDEEDSNYYQEEFLKEAGSNINKGGVQAFSESEDEKTELLIDFQDSSIAYLESEFSGERIYLKKFPFIIGKLKNGADHVLESTKVSRLHAKFDYDNGSYYIEDMDSTNGTCVNGSAVNAHSRSIISDTDRISFADINFIFHC